MSLFSFLEPIARFFASLQLDDSTIALLALLIGMAGGWQLPGWHQQLKAKRARVERKPQTLPRKPD